MRLRMRTLRIGSTEYRWTVEECHYHDGPACHPCFRVRVWREGKNSQYLSADLIALTPDAPDPRGCRGRGVAFPASGTVRRLIDHAESHGWNPSAPSQAQAKAQARAPRGRFALTPDADLELHGFALTHALRPMQHLIG